MKNFIHYLLFATTFFSFNLLAQEDFSLGEEFSDGDLITAESFNQIFDTIEKVNRTIVDADLVGTWKCDLYHLHGSVEQKTGYTLKSGFINEALDVSLQFTASSASTSAESVYTMAWDAPLPFFTYEWNGVANASGNAKYVLLDNKLFAKDWVLAGSLSNLSPKIIEVYFNSPTQVQFAMWPDAGVPSITCDSATPVPISPSGITATNAQTQVNIAWTDNSSDETGFKIYRKLNSEASYTQLATGIVINSYVDTTITEGQTAIYYVIAYNSNGESSIPVTATATLDSIKPIVSSYSSVQTGSYGATKFSVIFSEPVVAICPTASWNMNPGTSDCPDGVGIEVTGSNSNADVASFKPYPYPAPVSSILEYDNRVVWTSGTTITIKIKKDFFRDANGNVFDTDYTFTLTAPEAT